MEVTFRSKRDPWLVVVIWVAAAVLSVVAAYDVIRGRGMAAAGVALAVAFMLSVLYGTQYHVSDTHLKIRCGIFRWSIPRESIVAVHASEDNISAPATSLDRLEIKYDDNRKRVLVSPVKKTEFCAALGFPRQQNTGPAA